MSIPPCWSVEVLSVERIAYNEPQASLQPGQAVAVLNERVKHVGKLNADIADWLQVMRLRYGSCRTHLIVIQERRKVEDLYVQGLRKLARRQPPDESSELG